MGKSSSTSSAQDHQQERLQMILDATSEGWWEWDLVTNQTFHSPHWYKMLGFESDYFESSLEMWEQLIHPEDRLPVITLQNYYIRHDQSWEIEFRMRNASGIYLTILSKGKVVKRDEEGNPWKVVGIHVNITEKRRLEALEEEKQVRAELMKGIIRVSHGSFNVYDFLHDRITLSSGLSAKTLGYTDTEFKKLSEKFLENLVHPEDRRKLARHVLALKAVSDLRVYECTFRMLTKEGDYKWITLKNSVYKRDKKGNPLQMIGSAIDVSQHKILEISMKENVELLEHLSWKNSHKLRGPVATIIGLLAMMKQDHKLSAEMANMLGYMERTISKLDTVIHEFNRDLNANRTEEF